MSKGSKGKQLPQSEAEVKTKWQTTEVIPPAWKRLWQKILAPRSEHEVKGDNNNMQSRDSRQDDKRG
jgi:hypothetical protein